MQAISISLAMLAAGFRGQMQYRTNFVLQVTFGLGYQGTGIVFIWVVLNRFQSLAGWSLGQIAFLYGLRLLIHGLFVIFFGRLSDLDRQIREGKFDRYLIRPLPPLLQIMATEVRVSAVGDALGGLGLFLAANALVRVDWSPPAVAYLVLAIVGGCLVEAAIQLVIAGFSFRALNTRSLVFLVDNIFSSFGNYPLSIYGAGVRWLLTFGVPVAFVAYFPAAVLLGRSHDLAVPPLIAYLAPAAGILWFALAYQLFRHELRAYQSSGH
jgi:ABC-2 type transport system permease protein